jgi:hypothetical protein
LAAETFNIDPRRLTGVSSNAFSGLFAICAARLDPI